MITANEKHISIQTHSDPRMSISLLIVQSLNSFRQDIDFVAEMWWAYLDLNQGLFVPILESLIPGYALDMRQALADGDIEGLERMLDLLIAIGPLHIKQCDED